MEYKVRCMQLLTGDCMMSYYVVVLGRSGGKLLHACFIRPPAGNACNLLQDTVHNMLGGPLHGSFKLPRKDLTFWQHTAIVASQH